jgi:hypothetical protein
LIYLETDSNGFSNINYIVNKFSCTTIMHSYSCTWKCSLLLNMLVLFHIAPNMFLTYSLSLHIRNQVKDNIKYPYRQVILCYECYIQNVAFTHQLIAILAKMLCIQWLHIVLILSGDIHPNPSPSSTNSSTESLSTTSSMSLDLASLMSSGSCLSVLQYNVQSLLSKIEILTTEFSIFDVLAFSETWLNPSVSNSDIFIPCFHAPERNDRVDDSHGGVSLYIKNSLFYKRRMDFEPRKVENVWVEIILSQSKRILLGIVYRPPGADSHYTTLIEHSLNLAEEQIYQISV